MVAALPFVALAATAAGTMLKGISQFSADQYQAQVAKNNKATAAMYKEYAAQQTSTQVDVEGLKARQELGGARVSAAGRGLGVNTGSAADQQTSQRELGAFSQAQVQQKGAQQVYGYATEEQQFQAEKQMEEAKSYVDLGGAVISTVGEVAAGIPDLPGGSSSVSAAPADLGSDFTWMQGGTGGNAYQFTGSLEEGAPAMFPVG